MKKRWYPGLVIAALLGYGLAAAQEARIVVHADKVSHELSRYLTGACIEDVNHEIYGGIYSQMIFGESFQEPEDRSPAGFKRLGGQWRISNGVLEANGSPGDKLVSELPAFQDGEIGVEIYVPDRKLVNAGLITRVKATIK